MRNKLRILLNSKGIKTIDLAKKMNLSAATLNKKIKGDIRFSENDISVLLKVLSMTYEEVFENNISVIAINGKSYYISTEYTTEIITILEKYGKAM
jgi:transcriptional regulator with XRE-family HTH domain